MLVSQVLNDYLKKYPIYNSINFSIDSKSESENLHPLFVLTQYIIDKFISDGNKRIAIVLPDNECNILPLIIAKYFSNVKYESDYAGSVLEDIEIGQHIRLGKAVVEFGGIIEDENEKRRLGLARPEKYIKFTTGRKEKTTVYCPVNGVHYLFEKTEGALSLYKVWNEARKEAEEKLKNADGFITALKVKRTALRKTIALLSAKNDFKEFTDTLYINGQNFEDAVAYGEIDLDSPDKFKLYNKGRLDCLPSIAVTTKIEEIYYLLKDKTIKDKVFAVFSTLEKFDEIISNPDTFKKILKQDIPFVAFIPESGFENCPLLTDFGFDLWHWKPSTMKSEALLVTANKTANGKNRSLFGRFSEKVNRAALSDFKMETSNNKSLRKLVRLISSLSQQAYNADNILRQFVRKVWAFQNKLTWLLCPIDGKVRNELEKEIAELCEIWETQKRFYSGQAIESIIEEILENFVSLLDEEKPAKLLKIESFFSKINGNQKSILVLLPNKYQYFPETFAYINSIRGNCNIRLQTLSDFYSKQERSFDSVDYLIVTWFDKDEYIHIKQTYCYENLVFILYDYENKWRERYVKRFDECIPHESIKKTADKISFAQEDIYDKPLDRIFTEDTEEFDEISDYNIPNTIIRATFGNTGIEQDSAEAIECVPVLLSEEKIAYFYPTHDVIDVTGLSKGDIDRPTKKDAIKLKRGDKILIRQSDKDIIREKADILMAQKGENDLRAQTESWSTLLSVYAEHKSIVDVCRALNNEGGECTFQQVRYWLSGETIMPREKEVLIAIGIVASRVPELEEMCEKYLNVIDSIFEAGRKVQGYHQSAGRWLTSELKNRAQEIKFIANSSVSHGEVEGIGEIHIYTVEDVLNKEIIGRARINRIEDLY